MKKSVRIHLLVITTVVAIFVFAGIWYLRPSVPNELIEQAQARQLQPLLEINAPMRKPVAEAVPKTAVDKKALADELLPALTEQVSSSLEGPLSEKVKAQLASDEAFIAKLSDKLQETLNVEPQITETVTPQDQGDISQQLEALRSEVFATVGEELGSFFYQIEDMFEARLKRIEEDHNTETQAYVLQTLDEMTPSLVELLTKEFDKNKDAYLSYLAEGLKPYLDSALTEEELLLLYASYRDEIVADLVPEILATLEDSAKEAKSVPTATVPPPPASIRSVMRPAPVAKVEPAAVAEPVAKIAPKIVVFGAPAAEDVEPEVVPIVVTEPVAKTPKIVVFGAPATEEVEPEVVPIVVTVPVGTPSEVVVDTKVMVPPPPVIKSVKSEVMELEAEVVPIIVRVPAGTPSEVVVETKAMIPPPPVIKSVKSEVMKSAPSAAPTKIVVDTKVMEPAKVEAKELKPIIAPPVFSTDKPEVSVDPATYEQQRTEARNKVIEEVYQRINAQ